MEVLVLDGKSYVKASKAAHDLGYATDYVGQLCRSGQVDAHLIGRTWYVNQDQLGNHRFEKKRMSRVKAREQAKKAIEAHRIKVTEEPKSYRNIDIQYEADEEELIPKVKKLEVESVTVRRGKPEPEKYDSETVVLNKGEKVLMSGNLKVVDVTDGPVETDTVRLTPGRIRSGTITVAPREEAPEPHSIEVSTDATVAEEDGEAAPMSFEERLQALTDEADTGEVSPSPLEDSLSQSQGADQGSKLPHIAVALLILILVTLTLPLSQVQTYSAKSASILISYEFSAEEVVSKILERI